jgi:predicted transcriptional regulator of viral defense system
MNIVRNIFKKNNGYAYLKELKKRGVHTKTIKKMFADGIIEKVKPGLYKLVDMPIAAQQGMIDVCIAMPKAVVCLFSALSYYEMTTTVPSSVMVALPRGNKPVAILYPPTRVFYFSGKNYVSGIEMIETGFGTIRIYDIEKTIVDCFRFRKKLGDDVALEGLKNYLDKPDYNIQKVLNYAKQGRMYNIMKPYLEAYMIK